MLLSAEGFADTEGPRQLSYRVSFIKPIKYKSVTNTFVTLFINEENFGIASERL
jgi:hypothetical protein